VASPKSQPAQHLTMGSANKWLIKLWVEIKMLLIGCLNSEVENSFTDDSSKGVFK